jgi:hypothetical protein
MIHTYAQVCLRYLLAEHGETLPQVVREWADSEEDRREAVCKYACQLSRDFKNWFARTDKYSSNDDRFLTGLVRVVLMRIVWTRVAEHLLDKYAPLPRPADRFDMLPEVDTFQIIRSPSLN